MNAQGNRNDFLLFIQSVYPSLTKLEKIVADYTLQNSSKVCMMSITELAEACQVSLTTVSRLCKTLKLRGYQEYRMCLAMSSNESEQDEREDLPAGVTIADAPEVVAKKLLQSHISALNETYTMLDVNALKQAAGFIDSADQVRFFGVGGSNLTAMEGMFKFLHIMPNVYCLSDTMMQTMGASTLNEHDVAIFISHSGDNQDIVNMAKMTRNCGAKIIVITRYSKSKLAECADVVLQNGGFESPMLEGSYPSKIAQTLVLDLLFTEVYRMRYQYSRDINNTVTRSVHVQRQ